MGHYLASFQWSYLLLLGHVFLIASFSLRALWRKDLSPPSRLAWVMVLLALPYLGVVIYLFFGEANLGRTFQSRHGEIFEEIHEQGASALGDCEAGLAEVAEGYHPPFRLAASVNGFQTTLGNRAELMPDAAMARSRLLDDIREAKDHVHVLYYIWLNDETGTNVADALIDAAKRGVTCRAMADSLGSRAMVKSEKWKEMREAGVILQAALPFQHLLRTILFSRLDLRNHRKITVIDGKITYCGSQNCADPEFRVKPAYAPWIDILVRWEGPVVAQNQLLFASDWMLHDKTAKVSDFPLYTDPVADGLPAQVFGDGPTERVGATPQLFTSLLGVAQRKVVISTPYFVPDPTVLNSLCAAASRGVELTMIFPAKNDSWIVAAVSQSYYRNMLEAGIRIFEYHGGLLHSKTYTMDGCVSLIGSTNMDLRSFDLNYENDILFHDAQLTADILARQEDYLAKSTEVHLEDVENWSVFTRLKNNAIATIGPVL